MNVNTYSLLRRRGLFFLGVGLVLRLICGGHWTGDIANFIAFYGMIYLAIDVYENRHKVSAEDVEEEELFQDFLAEDPVRSEMSLNDARAAYIAWRDTRHYGQ